MQARRAWTIKSLTHRDADIERLQAQLNELNQRLNELRCPVLDRSNVAAIRARALTLSREIDEIRSSASGIDALTELLRR